MVVLIGNVKIVVFIKGQSYRAIELSRRILKAQRAASDKTHIRGSLIKLPDCMDIGI